jgi:hypothetical protein
MADIFAICKKDELILKKGIGLCECNEQVAVELVPGLVCRPATEELELCGGGLVWLECLVFCLYGEHQARYY